MIAAVQKKLGVQVDGRAGTETWGAIYAALSGIRISITAHQSIGK